MISPPVNRAQFTDETWMAIASAPRDGSTMLVASIVDGETLWEEYASWMSAAQIGEMFADDASDMYEGGWIIANEDVPCDRSIGGRGSTSPAAVHHG